MLGDRFGSRNMLRFPDGALMLRVEVLRGRTPPPNQTERMAGLLWLRWNSVKALKKHGTPGSLHLKIEAGAFVPNLN